MRADPAVHGDAPSRSSVSSTDFSRGVAARLMEASRRQPRTAPLWLGVRAQRAPSGSTKCGFADWGSHPFQLDRTGRPIVMMHGSARRPPDRCALTAFARVRALAPMVVGAERTAGQGGQAPGEFVWHHHDYLDELFLVHRGRFAMSFAIARFFLERATS
jgi:hypothetical protein